MNYCILVNNAKYSCLKALSEMLCCGPQHQILIGWRTVNSHTYKYLWCKQHLVTESLRSTLPWQSHLLYPQTISFSPSWDWLILVWVKDLLVSRNNFSWRQTWFEDSFSLMLAFSSSSDPPVKRSYYKTSRHLWSRLRARRSQSYLLAETNAFNDKFFQ